MGFNSAFKGLMKLGTFSTDFRKKKNSLSNFMKIRPVETESDDEANSSFSQFFECA
jgi:hypothetical protein